MATSPSDLRDRLHSVVAIPVTPFGGDGRIDAAVLAGLIDRMARAGVPVMTPNGHTGEFSALAPAEHALPVRVAVETMSGRGAVIAGIGYDTETAIAMGRNAVDAGADGVMIHQPVHPYRSTAGWVAYHRVIASALGETAIVLYIKDPAVDTSMLRELVEACPNVVGVKYAVPDVARFARLVDGLEGRELAWICGLAEPWAPFFRLVGATGFTSGLANVEPGLSLRMLGSLAARDYDGAMDVRRTIMPFEELRARRENANNVPVVKEALAQLGLCDRRVRPPLVALDAAERQEVAAILAAWAVLQLTPA